MSSNAAAERPLVAPGRAPRRVLAILWPAFVMAGVLEALVFVLIDPRAIHLLEARASLSPIAIHSIAFLVFWGVIATSGAITKLLDDEPPGEARGGG